MKNFPLHRLFRIICLAVLVGFPLSAARAADKPRAAKAPALADPSTFDLWIENDVFLWMGKELPPTLGNIVDALRENHNGQANFVLAPGLGKLKIADVKLRGGNLADQLEALRVASGEKFEWVANPKTPDPFGAPDSGFVSGSSASSLYVLREPTPTVNSERTVEAFNLSGYLQWLASKQDQKEAEASRMNAIQTSLKVIQDIAAETIAVYQQGRSDSAELPHFQFHRGANLLIVIGTRETVDIVQRIINALPGQNSNQASGIPGMMGYGINVPTVPSRPVRVTIPPRPLHPGVPGAPAAPAEPPPPQ